MSEVTKIEPTKSNESTKKTKKESTFYYFYSTGCAFCKQLEPIIDELNSEGADILKLDISNKDNKGLKQEIST